MASISDSLLMLPREIPSYLKVAYSLRYADESNEGNVVSRTYQVAKRLFSLIKELLFGRPFSFIFHKNIEKLQKEFEVMGQTIGQNEKPICVYFVSAHDTNGAILGTPLYYYHHYKIRNLQKYFAVAAKVVSSQEEMKFFTRTLKEQYPTRPLQFCDIVSHGFKSVLSIHPLGKPETAITPRQLRDDLFEDFAPGATLLLDACLTGLGDRNIADEIARKTPGRTVLAPGPSLYFSKPVIRIQNQVPKVVSAVHGFAIFNAYTCKAFCYKEKMPSQYPYVKDESLYNDILCIASFPTLQNSWLDRYIDLEKAKDKQKVIEIFNKLSPETQNLVATEIWKNQGSPQESDFGRNFLRTHPLHETVRSAFRTVLNELIQEVRDYPAVRWAKILLYAQNIFQAVRAPFRRLCGQPAIPA